MNDEQATAVLAAVLELAVRLRDEVGPGVAAAARDVLAAAGGDALVAVTVAAALVRVDEPVDAWWQPPAGVPAPVVESAVGSVRVLVPCPSHSAYARHMARGEDPALCGCDVAERAYQRARVRPESHRVAARERARRLRAEARAAVAS